MHALIVFVTYLFCRCLVAFCKCSVGNQSQSIHGICITLNCFQILSRSQHLTRKQYFIMAALTRRFISGSCINHIRPIIATTHLSKYTFSQKQHRSGYNEPKHLLTIADLSKDEVGNILNASSVLKQSPISSYNKVLQNKTLLMLFEKVSLRTRVSFQVGTAHLGGDAIFYSVEHSPLGEKETFSDTGKVLSGYCDAIMARVKKREHVAELAKHATIPVINGLDDFAHPCQMLADLLTIKEHKILNGKAEGIRTIYIF